MDAISVVWPGGEHRFALRLGELRRLQDTCRAGPEEVFNRLRTGAWRVDDLIEPLRLGLIGGGMDEAEAGPMVINLFDQHPKADFKFAAHKVLLASLLGPEDDPPGKPEGETAPPENGNSPTSTPVEP